MKKIFEKEANLFISLNCHKNEIAFKEEQKCEYIGIVVSGKFVISSCSFNGKEMIYATLKPFSFFANNLIFSKNNLFKGDVVCKEDGTIKLINKENFLLLLSKYPSFLENYLKTLSEEKISLNNKIKVLSFDNAEERIIFFLKTNNNEYSYSSITSLAKELGLARETLSRSIKKLEVKKTIKKGNKKIILL